MSIASQPLSENRLLATLPVEEYERLVPHLETVLLDLGQILFHPDEELQYVHFPTKSVISLLTDLEDGAGMEVGLVGREGIVGISAFLGGSETKVATVQREGAALTLRADKLREEFRKGGALQNVLLRYTHALMSQISQSVVCNARHIVEGRLARWLLMFHDRVESNEFELTQDLMASMLGVRRASVTDVANKLQGMKLIDYHHGHFKILDRKGLEAFTCECYPVVKEKFDDFLL
jgi:CRP-like cAMP-binding protein